MACPKAVGLEKAVEIVASSLDQPKQQLVTLEEAHHMITAVDVMASFDYPQADTSLVDGFCLIAGDTATASPDAPVTLQIMGETPIGKIPDLTMDRGQCALISTGCFLPCGADAVVLREHADVDRDVIRIARRVWRGEHVAPKASVFRRQSLVIPRGTFVGAAVVATLAAMGIEMVRVLTRPRVAVVATGSEITSLGSGSDGGSVFESNTYLLKHMLEPLCDVPFHLTVKGGYDEFCSRIRQIEDCQLVLITGGTGKGSGDRVGEWLTEMGADLKFHGVDSAPGYHVRFATDNATCYLCLPGKPLGCFILFNVLVRPVFAKLLDAPMLAPLRFQTRLRGEVAGLKGRSTWMLGHLEENFEVKPVTCSSGLDVVALIRANCLLHIPPDRDMIRDGECIEVCLPTGLSSLV